MSMCFRTDWDCLSHRDELLSFPFPSCVMIKGSFICQCSILTQLLHHALCSVHFVFVLPSWHLLCVCGVCFQLRTIQTVQGTNTTSSLTWWRKSLRPWFTLNFSASMYELYTCFLLTMCSGPKSKSVGQLAAITCLCFIELTRLSAQQ